MKKLIICLAVAAFTFSCSKDDDSNGGGGSKITAKINGVTKNFTIVSVEALPESDNQLFVFASNSKNVTNMESITFSVEKGATGKTAVNNFSYSITSGDTDENYSDEGAFTIDVTTNAGKKLAGTFSGTLEAFDEGIPNATVTEGTFNLATK